MHLKGAEGVRACALTVAPVVHATEDGAEAVEHTLAVRVHRALPVVFVAVFHHGKVPVLFVRRRARAWTRGNRGEDDDEEEEDGRGRILFSGQVGAVHVVRTWCAARWVEVG